MPTFLCMLSESIKTAANHVARCDSGSQRTSNTGEPLYTPASRGIHTPLEVDGALLHSLCLQALPRGSVETSHQLTGLHEDRDGMGLTFQVWTDSKSLSN